MIRTYNLYPEKDTQFCRLDTLPRNEVRWLSQEDQLDANGDTTHLFWFVNSGVKADITYSRKRRVSIKIESDSDSRGVEFILDYLEKAMGGRLIAA